MARIKTLTISKAKRSFGKSDEQHECYGCLKIIEPGELHEIRSGSKYPIARLCFDCSHGKPKEWEVPK